METFQTAYFAHNIRENLAMKVEVKIRFTLHGKRTTPSVSGKVFGGFVPSKVEYRNPIKKSSFAQSKNSPSFHTKKTTPTVAAKISCFVLQSNGTHFDHNFLFSALRKKNTTPSVAGGHSTFFGLLNTFVHIVMYTYYMFSAMGPQYQKYLWWKKYLTSFQMMLYT
uniref:Uncharacterized protein n=1 Tax=Megaselia scalaris TaxID=36166 RepID=T1GJU9_MEGSC